MNSGRVYQIDLRSGAKESRAWAMTREITRALCEVVPVADIDPLLSIDDCEVGRATRDIVNIPRATEEERRREWWHSGRRIYAECRPTGWDGLVRRGALDPANPFSCELWRAGGRMALQYRGVLLGRMHTPALRALEQTWRGCIGEGFDRIRGWNLCPRGGFVPWHSNQVQGAGWRAYVIYCDHDERSDFRYWDGERMVRVPDHDGVLNIFEIRPDPPLFWHAVVSDTRRVSCGFRLTDVAVSRLLERSEWIALPAIAKKAS